jgi:hypothetical protein
MSKKKIYIALLLLLLSALAVAISCGLRAAKPPSGKQENDQSPRLYIISTVGGNEQILIAGPNLVSDQTCLVIATHGWFERTLWPQDLALAISKKVDSGKWICGWYDWRNQAMVVNPTDAAKYGKDTAGPLLGKEIVRLSENWQHIHLIGHSAGSWVINEAAKIIAKETKAEVHLTYLDAYVPTFWNEDELGEFGDDPNVAFWNEHYFTRDITLGVTEKLLKHAHNVDLTDVTPGINDHKFPWHWYHATVIGRFAPGQRYEGEKLFSRSGKVEYGFVRSLETGEGNWKTSIALKPGSEPMKIKADK